VPPNLCIIIIDPQNVIGPSKTTLYPYIIKGRGGEKNLQKVYRLMELPTICSYGQLFRYSYCFQKYTSATKLVQVLSNLSNCHQNFTNVNGVVKCHQTPTNTIKPIHHHYKPLKCHHIFTSSIKPYIIIIIIDPYKCH